MTNNESCEFMSLKVLLGSIPFVPTFHFHDPLSQLDEKLGFYMSWCCCTFEGIKLHEMKLGKIWEKISSLAKNLRLCSLKARTII